MGHTSQKKQLKPIDKTSKTTYKQTTNKKKAIEKLLSNWRF